MTSKTKWGGKSENTGLLESVWTYSIFSLKQLAIIMGQYTQTLWQPQIEMHNDTQKLKRDTNIYYKRKSSSHNGRNKQNKKWVEKSYKGDQKANNKIVVITSLSIFILNEKDHMLQTPSL